MTTKTTTSRKVTKRKKTTKKVKKWGAPTKLNDEMKDKLAILFRKGLTEKEVCSVVSINESTLTKWKQRFPDFFTEIQDWKYAADALVERALFEKANGYKHLETKVFCNNGEIITHETMKVYPPDTKAATVWLCNRRPKQWRDKHEGEDKDLHLTVNITR